MLTITSTGTTKEVLNELQELLSDLAKTPSAKNAVKELVSQPEETEEDIILKEKPVKKKRKRRTKAEIEADKKAKEEAEEDEGEDEEDEEDEEEVKKSSKKKKAKDSSGGLTLEDVYEAQTKVIQEHGKPALRKLLQMYTIASTEELGEDEYQDFIEDCSDYE